MAEPENIQPGEFHKEPKQGTSLLSKGFAVVTISVGVIALSVVVWIAYQEGTRSSSEVMAPVIRADQEPIKRAPNDPGGLDVPHQNKLVFGRLAPGQIEEPLERLLPPPEEPTERSEVLAKASKGFNAPAPDSASNETTGLPAVSEPQVVTKDIAAPIPDSITPPSPPQRATAPAPSQPQSAEDVGKPITTPEPEPKVQAANAPDPQTTSGIWRVQLAAVSSQEKARAEWTRIKARNDDLLGALVLNVQSVKLDRGIYYRIQTGPLPDRVAARNLCDRLKARDQDCLVIAP